MGQGRDARRDLALLYRNVRSATEALCRPLAIEDQVVQSMPDTSPTKWHLAHTSWFFETFVLARAVPDYASLDPRYATLFNSYYHAAGGRHPRPERGLLSRPTVAEARAYRAHVDRHMELLLAGEHGALDGPLPFLVELGLNHEEQHQELILTDVKHVLARNPLEPAYRARAQAPLAPESAGAPESVGAPASTRAGGWVSFDGGLVEIGADDEGFAFDNERPRHRRWLDPFELARTPVTTGEYLEFMADGGYERSDLWLSDGWDARQRERWEAPLYWKQDDGAWRQVTLGGALAVEPSEPVCHVSFYEADAYARWKGVRLPSEEEWEHAARGVPVEGNLLESGVLHPAPLSAAGDSAQQLFGDVWEWTASPYAPYPGFRAFEGMVGEYNGKWMSNRYVLRGGSCVTPRRHVRATYRNFFGPEARWQFTGFRLARSATFASRQESGA